jgi:hypothetical protein
MAHQLSLADCRTSPVRVWACLAAEHRTQVIRLMAQLAFKLVMAQPNSPLREVNHAAVPECPQNSA